MVPCGCKPTALVARPEPPQQQQPVEAQTEETDTAWELQL
jgi:hypothetical protein